MEILYARELKCEIQLSRQPSTRKLCFQTSSSLDAVVCARSDEIKTREVFTFSTFPPKTRRISLCCSKSTSPLGCCLVCFSFIYFFCWNLRFIASPVFRIFLTRLIYIHTPSLARSCLSFAEEKTLPNSHRNKYIYKSSLRTRAREMG